MDCVPSWVMYSFQMKFIAVKKMEEYPLNVTPLQA
jgi:hypothetical protein